MSPILCHRAARPASATSSTAHRVAQCRLTPQGLAAAAAVAATALLIALQHWHRRGSCCIGLSVLQILCHRICARMKVFDAHVEGGCRQLTFQLQLLADFRQPKSHVMEVLAPAQAQVQLLIGTWRLKIDVRRCS